MIGEAQRVSFGGLRSRYCLNAHFFYRLKSFYRLFHPYKFKYSLNTKPYYSFFGNITVQYNHIKCGQYWLLAAVQFKVTYCAELFACMSADVM